MDAHESDVCGRTSGTKRPYKQLDQIPKSRQGRSCLDKLNAGRRISGWFLALIVSAALLAPVGILLGRIAGRRLRPWISGVAIAAATVQVIGLSRWVLLVPGISDNATVPALTADAHQIFEQLHFWLGTIIGETIGYTLTATFTVLVVVALNKRS